MTPEQAAALATITAAVYETHAQQQHISVAAALLAASLEGAPPPPPPPVPTYAITASAEQIDEGQAVAFTVSTTHVPAGTTLPYRLQGAISVADLDGVPLVGTVTIGADGTAMLVVPTRPDLITEGDEVIEMVLDMPGVLAHAAATIRDTSVTPPPPTYSLTPAPSTVNEGASITFWLATTGVSPGTSLTYSLTGVAAADVSVPLEGAMIVGADGTASLVVPVIADSSTEGAEVMTCTIGGGLAVASATIADTSVTPPPPPPAAAERFVEILDAALSIAIRSWFYGTTYDRNARFVSITTDTWPCEFYAADYAGNGLRPCSVRDYHLLVDGVQHASITLPVGAMGGTITLRASEIEDGWHLLRVVPASGSETSIPCAVYVRRGAVAPTQSWMYVQAASHDHLHAFHYSRTVYAKVPAAFNPTVRPLPDDRTFAPLFATVPSTPAGSRNQLIARDIVVHRPGDCYRTRLSQGAGLGAGVLNAAQIQAYYWSYMVGKFPGQVASLDGPRGFGNVAMATHLQFGRNGGLYFTDPWRVGHIAPDGTVRTIAGYRQQPPARLDVPVTPTSGAGSLELVGDWSGIPADRRGFHELWGMAFDARTLVVDEAATPIPNGVNPDGSVKLEKPHLFNPVAFVPDSQNNRICKLEWDRASHATPVKVTEFLTGLGDPWDVVCVDGVLYVSERTSHRIAAYDATTGALIRVVVSGLPLASMNVSIRRMQRNAGVTLADARAQPCVAPEGLRHLDGWLYFGSLVQKQIRRVHLVTGALEVVVPEPYTDDGANFFKLDVSLPGTFGPPGTVWLCTFSGAGYSGRPAAYLPGGAQWDYGNMLSGEGPGRVWTGIGYACAVAIGVGRMAHASSEEGIWLVSKSIPSDGSWGWARMQFLERMWMEQGWHLTHGPGGWGYYGLPLPWGVSTDIDDLLRASGLVPTSGGVVSPNTVRRFTDG